MAAQGAAREVRRRELVCEERESEAAVKMAKAEAREKAAEEETAEAAKWAQVHAGGVNE